VSRTIQGLVQGERITVTSRGGAIEAVRTVADVKKLYIVDSKGKKWSRKDGYPVPYPHGSFGTESVTPWVQKHSDDIALTNAVGTAQGLLHGALGERRLRRMPLKELQALVARLEAIDVSP
jgi:hypothetical protein